MTSSVSITRDEGLGDAVQAVSASLPVDWAATWRPDASFWQRIDKGAITELVTPILGAEWIKAHIGEKKALLAERLGDIFTG